MKRQGTVVKWDDARGFGFIRAAGSAGDVFFHVRDYRAAGGGAPRQGLAVTFEEIHVGGKGPRAMAVQPTGAHAVAAATPGSHRQRPQSRRSGGRRPEQTPSSNALVAIPLMLGYAVLAVWGVWSRHLPWWVLPGLFFLNVFTFFAYWLDKYAAGKGEWRIAESTLHLWSLAGGWPGAWMAQQLLRHKSSKQSFRQTYWTTVVFHCAALGASIWWLPGWLATVGK